MFDLFRILKSHRSCWPAKWWNKSQMKMRPRLSCFDVLFSSFSSSSQLSTAGWKCSWTPFSTSFSPHATKKGCWDSFRWPPNHLRLHLTTAEAHWSDTAEPGIVSNAFIHSPSHWQTLWNGWNPSLVKLAQKPSILDPFHFRELCHMLTVIHEALLAQRGVWQNGWGRMGEKTGVV